jgi:putative heme-binding domain-containing protein
MRLVNALRVPRSIMFFVLVLLPTISSLAQETAPSEFAGPIKIAKLLWKANKANAATTLTKAINTGIERKSTETLIAALQPLQPLVFEVSDAADLSDPRLAVAVSIAALLSSDRSQRLGITLDRFAAEAPQRIEDRELLLRVWLLLDQKSALNSVAESLVADSTNAKWAAVAIRESLASGSQAATEMILAVWPQLPEEFRVVTIEPLSASAESMTALIDAVQRGVINKDLVNTNQLRKWIGSENKNIISEIESVWGKIRESDNAERQALVARVVKQLNAGVTGSASRGNAVFARVCSQCHQLHGQGFEVGPNITGNGRGNLGQLVSNVLDPSMVIGEAFEAMTILTTDGEVIAGLVAADNDRYLKIKVQGGKVIELSKESDIEEVKSSTKSLMPEGLESQLTEQELFDLFAYLCLLKPLDAADNELIPGTPEDFVQP